MTMIRRFEPIETESVEMFDRDDPPMRDASHIEQWLNLVASLLPEELRESGVREEIDSHLRERVRDLMLAGASEQAAIHQAVGEFGDAAILARRFGEVTHTHRRRRRMQSILTGLGVLAVAGTTWLVAGTTVFNAPPASVFRSAEAPALPESFSGARIAIETPTTLGAIFDAMRETADSRLVVRWNPLMNAGLDTETEITHIVRELPLDAMLRELREVLDGFQGNQLDWRFTDGLLEIATREFFDERERTLVRYDISSILNSAIAGEDDIETLLTTFASPEDWEANGGDLARLQFVSDHLFIEAPPRMHEKIEWLLNELREKDVAAMSEDAMEMRSGLNPGDAVAVEVWGLYVPSELARIERVVEDAGELRLPAPFGVVAARGRTLDEIEQELLQSLDDVMNDPMVSVFTPVSPERNTTARSDSIVR